MTSEKPVASMATQLRVRYAETDAMAIAHHSSYILWFEVARTDLLREVGLPYRELEAMGIVLPTSELQIRYLAPAYYDDLLTIEVSVPELRSRKMTIAYRVLRDDTLLATATTVHIIMDRDTRRPTRLPESVMAVLTSPPGPLSATRAERG